MVLIRGQGHRSSDRKNWIAENAMFSVRDEGEASAESLLPFWGGRILTKNSYITDVAPKRY